MRHVAPVFALLLSFVPAIVRAESAVEFLSLPRVETWSGDFDGMIERRTVRILVCRANLFGRRAGLDSRDRQEFEKWINKRHAKPPFDIKVVFVLTRRDRIFEDLIVGKGDIAAANLTITTDRSSIVCLAKP